MVYLHEPVFGVRLYTRIVADTLEELREAGELLGLKENWIIEVPQPHFKIYATKLRLAFKNPRIEYLTLAEFQSKFGGSYASK